MEEDLDEFPNLHHFTEDIEAFAEDTGYEGTFSNRDFLFPEIKNCAKEKYDYFDPYDEDEWIVTGSVIPKNFYGISYDHNNSNEENFEVHQDYKFNETKENDEEFGQISNNNKSKPKVDGSFHGYRDDKAEVQQKTKVKPRDYENTAEDTEAFLGYAENKDKEPDDKIKLNEIEEESFKNSFDNFGSPSRAEFKPVDKSDLPATAKIDSILSRELK